LSGCSLPSAITPTTVIRILFGYGGSYGEGVLIEDSKVVDYYNSVSGSWGLQIGAQSYGYAVFLMTDKAIRYIKETKGWELGVGPTVVVVDEGVAKNLSTSSLKDDAYAFIFSQQGLMAGVSIEGTKISRINR
jgi:lipid-binding SYLF domain-containing protein